MKDVIYELVELALSLMQTQLKDDDFETAVLDIIEKALHAYEEQTGEPLNPQLVQAQLAI